MRVARDNPYVRTGVYLARSIVYAVVIGAAGACIAWAFDTSLGWLSEATRRWWLFGLPVAGAAVCSLISRWYPVVRSDGIQQYIYACREKGYELPPMTAPAKFAASLATLASGGSGGKVGPVVLTGGAVGRALTRVLPWTDEKDHQEATACGAAAAVGALLGCPLGGGLFAVEVMYESSIDYRGLFGAVLCSTAAFFFRQTVLPIKSYFVESSHSFTLDHLLPVLAGTALAGLVGLAFVSLYALARRASDRAGRFAWLTPTAGAVGCVALAWVCGPELMGVGENLLRSAWMGELALSAGLLLLAGKLLATVSTVGSGGSGGLFFPAAVLGSLCGTVVCGLFGFEDVTMRHMVTAASVSATLASMLNAPIAAAVIQIELYGVGVAPAAVLGSVLGYLIGRPKVAYRYASPRAKGVAPLTSRPASPGEAD